MPRTLHSENIIFSRTNYTSSTCEQCLLKSICYNRGSVDDVQRCRLCLFLQLMVINNIDFMLSFKILTSRSKLAFLNNRSPHVTPSLKGNFSHKLLLVFLLYIYILNFILQALKICFFKFIRTFLNSLTEKYKINLQNFISMLEICARCHRLRTVVLKHGVFVAEQDQNCTF